MTIAQELEGRLAELSDPKVKWVQGTPHRPGEQCLIQRWYDPRQLIGPLAMSNEARAWMSDFIKDYSCTVNRTGFWHPFDFNDAVGQRRQNVLWMLEEAVEQARWEGV